MSNTFMCTSVVQKDHDALVPMQRIAHGNARQNKFVKHSNGEIDFYTPLSLYNPTIKA